MAFENADFAQMPQQFVIPTASKSQQFLLERTDTFEVRPARHTRAGRVPSTRPAESRARKHSPRDKSLVRIKRIGSLIEGVLNQPQRRDAQLVAATTNFLDQKRPEAGALSRRCYADRTRARHIAARMQKAAARDFSTRLDNQTMFGIVREICPRNRDPRIRVGDHAGKSAAHIDLVKGLLKDPSDFGKVPGLQGAHPSATTLKMRVDLAGMAGTHELPS